MISVTAAGAFAEVLAGAVLACAVRADGAADVFPPSCAVVLSSCAGRAPAGAAPVISVPATAAASAAFPALETIPTRVPQLRVHTGVFAGVLAGTTLPVGRRFSTDTRGTAFAREIQPWW
ncbi:hypothetical protein GTW69_43295 [Streptomyces sp. SID7760]|nr:hypothetical protein [Streptomyces sp. SID7760]